MKPGTAYLSGKMTGVADYNFPAFHAAAADLRSRGWNVISPAELEDLVDYADGVTREQYRDLLMRDLNLISYHGITDIVVLPGWEQSGGARAEVALGLALKLPILAYPGLEPAHESTFLLPPPARDRPDEMRVRVVSVRTEMLLEAASLVDGDRNNQYGDPLQDFRRTAAMWSAYFGIDMQPHDVAAAMALLKVSRIRWAPRKRDSWVDLAGYAACGLDCSEREAEVA